MMSGDSGPSTSTTSPPNGEISSDLATLSTAQIDDHKIATNTSGCCCNATTRKFASLAYVAFLFVTGVVFLVAANVDTDKQGITVGSSPVYRYLAVVLSVAILWMASFLIASSKRFSHDSRKKWFGSYIEPQQQLIPENLLVGVMFFGLGSSFMTMVELLEFVAKYNCSDKDPTMVLYYVLRMVFIYVQLYFFYKMSRKDFEKVLFCGHFFMMHLIAVNLATWIVTFVYDSAEELEDAEDHRNESTIQNSSQILFIWPRHWGTELHDRMNSTTRNCTDTVNALRSTAKSLEPYLYTFTMEYCLISAGLLLNAWLLLRGSSVPEGAGIESGVKKGVSSQSVAQKSQHVDLDGRKKLDSSCKQRNRYQKGKTRDDGGQHGNMKYTHLDTGCESDDWEKVNAENMPEVGTLWRFGFIFGLGYIPAFVAIIFNVIFSDDKEQDQLIYIGMQAFFFLSILVASCIGIVQIQKKEKNQKEKKEKNQEEEPHGQVDFILLAVSLVGVFFLDLLIIVASVCEAGGKYPSIAAFLIVTNFMELLCSTAFTLFVRRALQCELPEEKDATITSSASRIREVVSFLFMLNICFWVMYTFEVKKSNTVLAIVEKFYTKEVWFYLSHVVYPLAVFFYFHGSVCMVEILNHYSISKTKTSSSNSVSMSTSHAAIQA